jgi:hypothetical protein
LPFSFAENNKYIYYQLDDNNRRFFAVKGDFSENFSRRGGGVFAERGSFQGDKSRLASLKRPSLDAKIIFR